MKLLSLIACAACSVVLASCASTPSVRIQTVTVDKPIPFIPPPPILPPFHSYVDQLTPASIADPGSVGVAYRLDMLQLRQLYSIQEEILALYRNSSSDFTEIIDKINHLYGAQK